MVLFVNLTQYSSPNASSNYQDDQQLQLMRQGILAPLRQYSLHLILLF